MWYNRGQGETSACFQCSVALYNNSSCKCLLLDQAYFEALTATKECSHTASCPSHVYKLNSVFNMSSLDISFIPMGIYKRIQAANDELLEDITCKCHNFLS